MEQKQLDGVEEDTFFGEEFIEEDNQIKNEEEKPKKEKKKSSKKTKVAKNAEEDTDSPEELELNSDQEELEKEEEVQITPTNESTPVKTAPAVDPWDEDERSGQRLYRKEHSHYWRGLG